jgi:hypothetical protein
MVWSASKVFMAYLEDSLENTSALDTNADTYKAALYDNDVTPDQTVTSANTAYNAGQWVASGNEVTDGTNWDTAGEPLTGVASSFTSNVYKFDATDTPQSGVTCTLANVYGCLVYDDTSTTPVADQGMSYHYFGGVQGVTGGSFTIQWHATNGLWTLTG